MISIRRAEPEEAEVLTAISFAAKRHWNYPETFMELWKDELTITEEYIKNNEVYVVESDRNVVGYFSMIYVPEDKKEGRAFLARGYYLDHMFLSPELIGQGIGTKCIQFMTKYCKERNRDFVRVLSDPYARGFYRKTGARYIKEILSNIPGRTVSLFEYHIH